MLFLQLRHKRGRIEPACSAVERRLEFLAPPNAKTGALNCPVNKQKGAYAIMCGIVMMDEERTTCTHVFEQRIDRTRSSIPDAREFALGFAIAVTAPARCSADLVAKNGRHSIFEVFQQVFPQVQK